MRLINSSVEIIDQEPSLVGVFKQIELAGRTCYKSEDKITETSAKEFVDRMVKSGHGAMLEHGTVYLINKFSTPENRLINRKTLAKYNINKYSIYNIVHNESQEYFEVVTTNYRVLVESNWLDDLQYSCEPTGFHKKRITVRFICDRGVSHEFVRHRVLSFAQESTRYCNYSKDKFGNELTFIEPSWFHDYNYEGNSYNNAFITSLMRAEETYLSLLQKWENKIPDARYKSGFRNNPWTPQQARQVLPNALKTELVITGTIEEWEGFFKLRCSERAHPDARKLALELMKEFQSRGYIRE